MLVFLTLDLTAVSHPQEYFSERSWPLYWHSYKMLREYLRESLCSEPREIHHHKRAKNHREIWMAGPLWWTTFVRWWDWGQSQLNHLPRSSNRWNPGRQPGSFQRKQVEAEQTVFFILEGWSQDPSITTARQTAECFPAQILFSHTLSVWDTSDLSWQIKSWIRRAELRLNWFEDICCSFSPYDSELIGMCCFISSVYAVLPHIVQFILLFTCYMESKISELISALDLFVNMDPFCSLQHNFNVTVSRWICSLTDKLHMGVSPDVHYDY